MFTFVSQDQTNIESIKEWIVERSCENYDQVIKIEQFLNLESTTDKILFVKGFLKDYLSSKLKQLSDGQV